MMQTSDDSLSARLFGQNVNAKGPLAIVVLVLCLALGSSMYLLYERTEKSSLHLDEISAQHAKDRIDQTAQLSREHKEITDVLKEIKGVNTSMAEGIATNNYLNLAKDEEKQQIKRRMEMPESLKRVMRN